MKPRDFHIGTAVKWLHSDDPDLSLATVFNCLPDPDKPGERILVFDPLPWSNDWGYADQYVHAKDGAPLGKWVPIKFDGEAVFHADITGLAAISVHDVNRIIRGKVSQFCEPEANSE